MLKSSLYNFIFPFSEKKTLFFNFYTLSLLALESGEAEKARKIIKSPRQRIRIGSEGKLRRLLLENGFILDENVDERALLQEAFKAGQIKESTLSLTVLPTLSCNFKCTYCYENPLDARNMSRDVEEALKAFVQEELQQSGRLTVTWFGGEPLLRKKTIESLSHSFLNICGEKNAEYSASIITNGYLLDGDTARWLKELKVTSAQVTLDGPPDVHDARRPLARGGGTFRTIVDNLKESADVLEITVRINVDSSNQYSIGRFLDLMIEEKLADKVGFYPGQTTEFTSSCGNISGICLGGKAFSIAALETSLELTSRGLPDASFPMAKNLPCGALRRKTFTITPSGGIVACWNHVAEPDEYIGHLLEPKTAKMEQKRKEWMDFDPFSLECRDCLVLPMCMGACPYLYIHQNRLACIGWKHHTAEHVLNYYMLKMRERQGDLAHSFHWLVDTLKKGEDPLKLE